jgi:hypothetical protein
MQTVLYMAICIIYNAFILFSIGKEIRKVLRGRKLSEAELARVLGMSFTAEIKVGRRRVIEFFIYPIIEYLDEEIKVR